MNRVNYFYYILLSVFIIKRIPEGIDDIFYKACANFYKVFCTIFLVCPLTINIYWLKLLSTLFQK